jgi:two-component system, LytTR family, response regulator
MTMNQAAWKLAGILIVEDERPARSELKRMLRDLGISAEIREAGTVSDAFLLIEERRPGLLLLDIQMPGGSGFDLLAKLGPDHPPVIFTTAHEQFAARAFENDAVDYLLKPFGTERLRKALSRIPSPDSSDERLGSGDVVLLKIDEECLILRVETIEFIEATPDGTLVHWGESSGIVKRTLKQLEQRLVPQIFFRCAREAILNVDAITKTRLDEHGALKATLISGREVLFSRRQSALFRNRHRI